MAFTVITNGSVQSGEPVTTDFGQVVKDNFDDHESRIGVIEAAVLTNEYDAIVANPAIAGFSTHTSISAAIGAVTAGARIIVLRGTFIENITFDKALMIEGSGRGTVISGDVLFNSSASNAVLRNAKVTGTITFASGATGCLVEAVYVPNTFTDSSIIDTNALLQNVYQIMQET